MELCIISIGGKIGFSTGSPLRLMEDLQILKPNFVPFVPRVLNRIYHAAQAAGNLPGLKGKIFNTAVEAKLERLHATGDHTHAFWDRIVFKKVFELSFSRRFFDRVFRFKLLLVEM
jgi:long-chain acyl-CoA synthetase